MDGVQNANVMHEQEDRVTQNVWVAEDILHFFERQLELLHPRLWIREVNFSAHAERLTIETEIFSRLDRQVNASIIYENQLWEPLARNAIRGALTLCSNRGVNIISLRLIAMDEGSHQSIMQLATVVKQVNGLAIIEFEFSSPTATFNDIFTVLHGFQFINGRMHLARIGLTRLSQIVNFFHDTVLSCTFTFAEDPHADRIDELRGLAEFGTFRGFIANIGNNGTIQLNRMG